MNAARGTSRRAKDKTATKKQESLPKDLQGFIVGRLPRDKLFTPRPSIDLSDGESSDDVSSTSTPDQRAKLLKEVQDLTMSPSSATTKSRSLKRSKFEFDYYGK